MSNLQDLTRMVTELGLTNSSNQKKDILKKYPECKELLMYTYNSFWKYGVTSKNCLKRNDIEADCNHYDNITKLLDDLRNREITGHDAIAAINAFSCVNSDYKELIWLIIDRNLKTRTDTKLINKVWKDFIPTFNVALAVKFDEKTKKKVDFDGGWFCSRKLDGCRCITIIDDEGDIKFFSRAGNEFTTLGKVRDSLKQLNITPGTVLDGEICIIDDEGNEDFTSVIKQIKKKDYTIPNPGYRLFDMISLNDFSIKSSVIKLSNRLASLKRLIPEVHPYVDVLEQVPLTETSFLKMQEQVRENGWEGLILRKDTEYQGKRSNDMLKVKKFHDAEYIVKDVEMGRKPIMVDGLMVEQDVLAAVKIEHQGSIVSVGSGFSDDERLKYFTHPEDIIGKTITVQYFEESADQNGKPSLRFPTIKFIFENGRTV